MLKRKTPFKSLNFIITEVKNEQGNRSLATQNDYIILAKSSLLADFLIEPISKNTQLSTAKLMEADRELLQNRGLCSVIPVAKHIQ